MDKMQAKMYTDIVDSDGKVLLKRGKILSVLVETHNAYLVEDECHRVLNMYNYTSEYNDGLLSRDA